MPLKHFDPFASAIERLDANVNPYVAMMREAAADGTLPIVFGDGLRGVAGRWRERFAELYDRPAPPARLVVEIGCHKGRTLLELARNHPETAFVGIDITYKRVVTTAQRARAAGLTNVFCVMANAAAIDQIFAPGEVDGVLIFFPDPWVKKKSQAKNRLVDAAFTPRLRTVLAPGGWCWLKTDQKIYFDMAAEALAGAGLEPLAGDAPAVLTTELARDYGSTFEQRFHEQNLPTYGARWASPAGVPSAAHML